MYEVEKRKGDGGMVKMVEMRIGDGGVRKEKSRGQGQLGTINKMNK